MRSRNKEGPCYFHLQGQELACEKRYPLQGKQKTVFVADLCVSITSVEKVGSVLLHLASGSTLKECVIKSVEEKLLYIEG